jgi:hypothetical protein
LVQAVRGRWVLCLIALGLAASASAQQTIRYAEPVQLSLSASETTFDAYGRRFSLTLTDNERVLRELPAARKQQLAGYKLLRGSLEGTPGSWVRLTQSARGIEGAIWDGRELYAVTRYENIEAQLITPLTAGPGQTVVYRLSDMRDALPRDFCALGEDAPPALGKASPTALDRYHAIVSSLEEGIVTPTVSRQIEISLIADTAFQQAEAPDPTAAMMARLNIVEGIFSEQLGLLVLATDIRLMTPAGDPFTSTKGTSLLEQLGDYRQDNLAVRARGVAHLMTGKDLDGTTAGIAYVGSVCDAKRGVSLSQRSYGTTISALIMAHELGHNFGAEHDGVPGTACAATPEGFIMAASVSGYSTFSQCSMDTMNPVLASASCVTAAQFADVALDAGASAVMGEAGRPFTVPFEVRSTGNLAAESVTATFTLPATMALTLDGASASQGSCSVSGLTATCALGDLPVDGTVQLQVIAHGETAGSFSVQGRVTAANDRLSSNNARVLPVTLRSGIDAGLGLSASATEAEVGEALQLHVDVSSVRALPVRNAVVSLTLNQPVSSATLPGGQCTVNASSVSCSIAEIAAGATRRITVQALARQAGPLFASASVSVPGDGDLNNNTASISGWVQAERDVELTTTHAVAELPVGAAHDIVYTLRSRGPKPTGDVSLLLSLPAGPLELDALDAGGAACARSDAGLWRCELGPLAAGASREVRLRVHGSAPLVADIVASALAADDGYSSNNNVNVQLRVDHVIDLAVMFASGGAGIEDLPIDGQVALRSQGRQSATGGTLDVDLHAAGVLRSVRIHEGAECALLSATRARCALPELPRASQLHVDWRADFAEPGEYDIRFSAATPGDTAATNDTLTRAVIVRPYLDAGVSGSLQMDALLGGQARAMSFLLTVDRRPLASARFVAGHGGDSLQVEAIEAPGGQCRLDPQIGGICEFVDLPASSSTTVQVHYRAAAGAAVAYPVVKVVTPGDVDSRNDAITARVESFAATDVEVRVGSALTGAASTTLAFPPIEVVNGAQRAVTPRLEITLPSSMSVLDVSAADAVCSGSRELVCDFPTLEAHATTTVSLNVRASAIGKFVGTVRVRAANDTNPANDTRDVSIEIAGNAQLSASGQSGKSGGGRMDLWSLLLLLWLKWGHSSFASKWGQGSRRRTAAIG